jgi:hypothetical protein
MPESLRSRSVSLVAQVMLNLTTQATSKQRKKITTVQAAVLKLFGAKWRENRSYMFDFAFTSRSTLPENRGTSMDANTSASPHAMTETHAVANENMASLFQPDTLLSGQYFDDRGRSRLLEPEHKLMLAILQDAVECFQANYSARCEKRKRVFDDAREWIFQSRNDWIFGFENICNVLEFDPEYIRKGLLRWKQRELAKPRSAFGRNNGAA